MKSVWERASVVACAVVWASSGYALEGWGEDFEQGLAAAKAEGRCVLVEFTGSDWCPPCMYVRRKVLPSPEFKSFTEKYRPVLVELDFPRGKGKVAPEVRELREQISQRYGVDAYPTMLVLDARGYPYAKVEGAGMSVEEYMADLQEAMERKDAFEAQLHAAREFSGTERARALLAALEMLPADIRAQRTDITDEVMQNDPEDTTGTKKAYERKKLRDTQLSEYRLAMMRSIPEDLEEEGFSEKGYMQAMRRLTLLELERTELLPEVLQILYTFVGESLAVEKNYAQALEYINKAIALMPDSEEAEALARLRLRLQEALQK